ncbi:MAG: hypothetical protein AAGG56_09270 [Pseudomonadota bacterium]
MAAPIAFSPIVWTMIRYGALIAVAAYASRSATSEPKDAEREHVLDQVPEGVNMHAHRAEAERAAHGSSRLRRTIRFGRDRAGLEIDFAALGRFRLRRVD